MFTSTSGSQPAYWHDIYSTTYPEIIQFKVLSTFTNGMTHTSAMITLTKYCANNLVVTEVSAPTNPQFMAHSESASGFTLPLYTNTQVTGCPNTNFEISSSNSNPLVAMSELQDPVDDGTGNGNLIVKPTDNSLHRGYVFYIKVTVDKVHLNLGDTEVYLGPYDLRMGCYPDSVIFTDGVGLVHDVALWVGDSLTGLYTFD